MNNVLELADDVHRAHCEEQFADLRREVLQLGLLILGVVLTVVLQLGAVGSIAVVVLGVTLIFFAILGKSILLRYSFVLLIVIHAAAYFVSWGSVLLSLLECGQLESGLFWFVGLRKVTFFAHVVLLFLNSSSVKFFAQQNKLGIARECLVVLAWGVVAVSCPMQKWWLPQARRVFLIFAQLRVDFTTTQSHRNIFLLLSFVYSKLRVMEISWDSFRDGFIGGLDVFVGSARLYRQLIPSRLVAWLCFCARIGFFAFFANRWISTNATFVVPFFASLMCLVDLYPYAKLLLKESALTWRFAFFSSNLAVANILVKNK